MYKDDQIWQMKKGDELHYCRFENYETAKKAKPELNLSNYELVYDDDIRVDDGLSDIQILDLLFAKFNEGSQIPNDFKGHSLSVSDLVNIEGNYYYIQDVGFKQLDDSFLDDMTLAKKYINKFCAENKNAHPQPFINYASFGHLDRVPLIETQFITGEDLVLNAFADLKNFRVFQELDGKTIEIAKYDSLKEMNENYLKNLNFRRLVSVDYKTQKTYAEAKKKARSERLDALAKLDFSTERYDLPFLNKGLGFDYYEFQDESWEYVGGIDMNGHERKDNFRDVERKMYLSASFSGFIELSYYGTNDYRDGQHYLIDPTDPEQVENMRKDLDEFIGNSDVLSVWKKPSNREGEKELVSDNEIIERKESIISNEPLDLTGQDKLNL